MKQLDNIEGEDVLWASLQYKVPPRTTIQLFKNIGNGPIYYALTKSRAFIINGRNDEIILSANITGAYISIINRMKISPGRFFDVHKSHGGLIEVGNVLFIRNGEVIFILTSDENPDLIVKIYESIGKWEEKKKLLSTLPQEKPEISDNNEVVLWRYETYIQNADDILSDLKTVGFSIKDFTPFLGLAKLKRVVYIITNKKAKIVSQKNESEIYFQCNLNDCEIVSVNKVSQPAHIQTILSKNMEYKTYGDIIFITNGKPIMMFNRVQDPDLIIELIEKNQKQNLA